MNPTRSTLEALAIALRADLEHAESHVLELAKWSQRRPVGYEVHAAALLLHHLYGAIEAILERSLRAFDGGVPG